MSKNMQQNRCCLKEPPNIEIGVHFVLKIKLIQLKLWTFTFFLNDIYLFFTYPLKLCASIFLLD